MRRLPRAWTAWIFGCVALGADLIAVPACAQQSQDGLSLDEYYRFSPPHPEAVAAEIRNGRVVISWQRPNAPPPGKIGYDPVVVRYKVYRIGENERRTLIGETAGMSFTDPAPLQPGARRYGVTAIQRSGDESGMSADAELRIP